MKRGEISKEPENELEGSRATRYTLDHSRRNQGGESHRKDDPTTSAVLVIAEGDDFFGEDYSEDGILMEDSDQY